MNLSEIEESEVLTNDKKRLISWQKEIKEIDNNRMAGLVDQFINKNKNMTLESADWIRQFLEFYKNQ